MSGAPDLLGFLWPWALAALLVVPLALLAYRRARGRAEAHARHPDLATLEAASTQAKRRWRAAPLLYLIALALAALALARPATVLRVSSDRSAVILALDVSRSMMATDVLPSRWEAARDALRAFVNDLPRGTRVGLVSFSGFANTVIPVTDQHDRLIAAVENLELAFGTRIGDAIKVSLENLKSEAAPGKGVQHRIILLTDGRNFGGEDPVEVALEAKRRGVEITAIGVGRVREGPVPGLPAQSSAYAHFDESTLKAIAEEGGGEYHHVSEADALKTLYRKLVRSVTWKPTFTEVTGIAALVAALALALSLAVSNLERRVV